MLDPLAVHIVHKGKTCALLEVAGKVHIVVGGAFAELGKGAIALEILLHKSEDLAQQPIAALGHRQKFRPAVKFSAKGIQNSLGIHRALPIQCPQLFQIEGVGGEEIAFGQTAGAQLSVGLHQGGGEDANNMRLIVARQDAVQLIGEDEKCLPGSDRICIFVHRHLHLPPLHGDQLKAAL